MSRPRLPYWHYQHAAEGYYAIVRRVMLGALLSSPLIWLVL
jgi:hypothetical protein